MCVFLSVYNGMVYHFLKLYDSHDLLTFSGFDVALVNSVIVLQVFKLFLQLHLIQLFKIFFIML